jgi:hypothetical protein
MEVEDHTPTLLDMGFTQEQITVALKHSQNKSLDGLVTWITDHPDLEEFAGKEPATGMQEEAPAQQGKPISGLVNQELAAGLEGMGYSKNVREKALLMTGNGSVEAALEWIENNKNAADFEEEMLMIQDESKPKLSAEEAAERAKELQVRMREQRKKKDAEEELERERNRIAGGKAMADAKRIMDEQQKKRDLEVYMKEKKEDAVAHDKILEQLEKDRRDRFGDKYVPLSQVSKEKPAIEQVQFGINQMRKVYPPFTYGDQLKVCWNTIKTVLGNILKNPDEPKFQTINLGNPNFKARVVDIVGGTYLLQQCGFVEENGHLVLKKKDPKLFQDAIALLEKEINIIS